MAEKPQATENDGLAMPACRDCVFFVPMEGKKYGVCHRYPPSIRSGKWINQPLTNGDNWCGEFQPEVKDDNPVPGVDAADGQP